MSPEVQNAKESVLKHGEIFLKGVFGDNYDPAVKLASEAVKKAIPGQVDDMVIDLVVANFAPALKLAILGEIEKVSPAA